MLYSMEYTERKGMHMRDIYPNIDPRLTGMKIEKKLNESGHTVKELQEFLNLEGPQPIYRWLRGKTLPSIYNLYAMAYFLDVKIDDLLESRTGWIPAAEYNRRDLYGYEERMYAYSHMDDFLEEVWRQS